jgi:hypothetical protein
MELIMTINDQLLVEMEFVSQVLRMPYWTYINEINSEQRQLYLMWYGHYLAQQRASDMPITGSIQVSLYDDTEYQEVNYSRDIDDNDLTIEEAIQALQDYRRKPEAHAKR